MKRLTSLGLAIATVFWATASLGASLEFIHDDQALYDFGRFHFEQIAPTTGQTWVVLKITPGPSSGAISDRGARRNPKTGHLEFLTDRPESLWVEEASAEVLAILTGEPSQKEYDVYRSWAPKLSARMVSEVGGGEEYRPFVRGGVAVGAIHENLPDKDPAKFSPLYLIPEDWAAFVKPAFEYFKANRALFDPANVKANRDQLEKLLQGENPLLAAQACRLLAESGNVDMDNFIKVDVASATGFRQTLFVRYALTHMAPEKVDKISAMFELMVDQTNSTQQLRPFALGAAYVVSKTGDIKMKQALSEIRAHIREKYTKIASTTAADEYIVDALRVE